MEEDKRFADIVSDPKFRRIPKNERKVKIDKRFQSMFKDKRFKVKYAVDKRGRPVNNTTTEDLKRYYELNSDVSSSSDDNEEENEEEGKYVKLNKPEDNNDIVQEENDEEKDLEINHGNLKEQHVNDKKISEEIKNKLQNLNVDYARGESTLFSDSSSDDEESSYDSDSDEEIDHKWGELAVDAETTEKATYRLAACNMDWDRIRASDLMVLFNSFIPPTGSIKSITIYPSKFGLERMKEEEIKGPIELVDSKAETEELDNEEGAKFHMEKLRQYQLNRLKYYYAVVVCDSANTADKIYTECDGMEYESSAVKIDLRFIPDDMTFDNEPKEICDKLPEPNTYQPRFFTTTALQQAKVDLTWDETNPERIEMAERLAKGKVDDVTDADLQAYVAMSSDEESEGEDNSDFDGESADPVCKYKALLEEIESKENDRENNGVEMEVTWGIDLKEKTDKIIKEKAAEKEMKTPFQQYLEKRKQKRKERKNKSSKNNENSDSDIPSDVDMNDPYFAEEFDKPDFRKMRKNVAVKEKSENGSSAELELLLVNEDDKKHFSLEKIQKTEEGKSKKKKKNRNAENNVDEDNFTVNINDDRFSALFTSHQYNIDPTDPHFKKTKGMDTIISEKLKRRAVESDEVDKKIPRVEKKKVAELNVLMKSIKRNKDGPVNNNK